MDFKTKIKSTVTTGTAPFDIASTTAVTNLNVDLLDDKHASDFALASQVLTNVPENAKFTDTVYTHPTTAGNKHIPTGGASGQVLKYSASGTATWQADSDTVTTINGKTGAISKADITALGIPAQDTVYTHPSGFTNQPTTALTGANVVSQITVNAEGHVSGIVSRSLTAANIGAAATSHTQAWSTITSRPTTVAGYGIIDAIYATDGVATESLTEPYSRIIQATVAPSGTVASTPFPDLWLDTASVPFKLKFWDGQIWQAINTWQ